MARPASLYRQVLSSGGRVPGLDLGTGALGLRSRVGRGAAGVARGLEPRRLGRLSPGRRIAIHLFALAIALASGFTAACRSTRPEPRLPEGGDRNLIESGEASWYGPGFHGRRTANGERFDGREMTAAHQTLPFGTLVEVVNLDNGRAAVVRINDRGPFVRRRILDLSRTAAEALGLIGPGLARVELYTVGGAAVPAPRPFTVQVGAFLEAERAQDLADELAPRFPGAEVRSDGTWHRVQVSHFDLRDDADDLRCRLVEAGYPAVVVEAPVEPEEATLVAK